MKQIRVTVNGESRAIEEGATLSALLETLNIAPKNLAIEHNGEFLALENTGQVVLGEGDRIELIRFVGGG